MNGKDDQLAFDKWVAISVGVLLIFKEPDGKHDIIIHLEFDTFDKLHVMLLPWGNHLAHSILSRQ
jgi:hypothetical protein